MCWSDQGSNKVVFSSAVTYMSLHYIEKLECHIMLMMHAYIYGASLYTCNTALTIIHMLLQTSNALPLCILCPWRCVDIFILYITDN